MLDDNNELLVMQNKTDTPDNKNQLTKTTEKDKHEIKQNEQALPMVANVPIMPNININIANHNIDYGLLVNFNSQEYKFTIYDKNKQLLGSVNATDIIKYITVSIAPNFLRAYDYSSSINTIEKFFLKKDTQDQPILLNHFESPIMGNIEMVLNLYGILNHFKVTKLNEEQGKSKESSETFIEIKNKINDMIYLVLNHALKLIVNIADVVKNDTSKTKLRSELVIYGIYITNKINIYIKESINIKVYECKNLGKKIKEFEKYKTETEKKLNTFEETLKTQNEQITKILDYINIKDSDIDKVLTIIKNDEHPKELSNNINVENIVNEDNNIKTYIQYKCNVLNYTTIYYKMVINLNVMNYLMNL